MQTATRGAAPAAIWIVDDGKPGHLNQSLGLAEALQRLRPRLDIRCIPAVPTLRALRDALRPAPEDTPRLLIGAGHGTHAGLLAWRRRAGCPAIVLMRPSLPQRLFDLCIEPRHDGGSESERCWRSDGPLTRQRPGAKRDEPGLILIGGPSPHFSWDGDAILAQLGHICDGSSAWTLTTSRRTPPGFLARLRERRFPGLECHAPEELAQDWLARELAVAAHCWVSPDSASMLYEALSAGCAVGLFELRAARGSRVAAGVRHLQSRALCIGFAAWDQGAPLQAPPVPLAEAERIAARILERGFL